MATSLLNTVGQLRASTQASTSRLRLYSTASKARRPAPRTHRIPASPSSPSVNSTAPLPRIVHPSPPPAVPHVDSAAAGRRGIDKAKVTSEPYDLSRQNWMDPPLVAKARAKSTKQRSVWESYLGSLMFPRRASSRPSCSFSLISSPGDSAGRQDSTTLLARSGCFRFDRAVRGGLLRSGFGRRSRFQAR